MHCSLLKAQTTPIGLEKFGGVKGGFLKISGGVLEIEFYWSGDARYPRHPWRIQLKGRSLATADIDG